MSSDVRLAQGSWSDRERQILDLIAERKTNREIAEALGLSFYTAKWHVSEVLSKLGVESRDEAALYWRAERGWRGRVLRAARALFPIAGAKWAVGLTAAGLGVAAIVAGVAMFGSTGTPTPAASSVSTPTDVCAAHSIQCTFARGIAQDLEANDGKAVLALSKPVQVSCPDMATSSLPGPEEYCRGSEQHSVTSGYVTGGDMDARLVSGSELASPRPADVPVKSDAYGTGALRLASVGCPGPDLSYSCDQRFAVAFTWIAPCNATRTAPCTRAVRIYVVDRSDDGRYLISSQGDYSVTSVLEAVINGGSPEMPFGRDNEMTFTPIEP